VEVFCGTLVVEEGESDLWKQRGRVKCMTIRKHDHKQSAHNGREEGSVVFAV